MTLTSPAIDLRTTPLSANIGAEIRGVDLKQPLSDGTVAELRDALLQYKVVFFPQQHLTPPEHLAFAQYFGEVTPAHPVIPGIEGHPEVFEIDYSKFEKLYATYGDVPGLEKAVDETCAAVIVEPIQGEGGVRMPPPGFLAACREITKKKGALLLFVRARTPQGDKLAGSSVRRLVQVRIRP